MLRIMRKYEAGIVFSAMGRFLLIGLLSACGGGGGGGGDSSGPSANSANTVAIAVAGATTDVARNGPLTLDGRGSSDADGDALTYTWTQTMGPDVTGGAGFLTGMMPMVTAPSDVSTLMFALVVNDGTADSLTDTVQINVMEDPSAALFVDGNNGDDGTGNGSRALPYKTIGKALASLLAVGEDIYVMSGSSYLETVNVTIPNGTSVYGGFDANWVRDANNNKTDLTTNASGVSFSSVNSDTWFSGFALTASNSATSASTAVSANSGTGTLYVQDNVINSGNANGASASSYGVQLANLNAARILRNQITAGNGGNGAPGANGLNGNDGDANVAVNTNATGRTGAQGTNYGFCAWGVLGTTCISSLDPVPGGSNVIMGGSGGSGGNATTTAGGVNGNPGGRGYNDGDTILSPSGADGGAGGFGGSSTNAGRPGQGGEPNFSIALGNGGLGGDGRGTVSSGVFVNNSAGDGKRGGHGGGGGGGGGGESGAITIIGGTDGGGGGGGGGGGVGGKGGKAGGAGGASIGILVVNIADAVIQDNTIIGGTGGNGAAGGLGGQGGNGGDGGNGYSAPGDGENGGGGGGGAHGGEGGGGGPGGGGPSFNILVGANTAPTISGNTLTGGTGGVAGNSAGPGGRAPGGRKGDFGSAASGRIGGAGRNTYHSLLIGGPGTQAQGGWAYGIFDVDISDGNPDVTGGNTITPGSAGTRGSAGDKNF